MNPPSIKVKKGAVVYDDAEQDRLIPRPPTPPRSRFTSRRARGGGRSVLVPLLAVAGGIFILFRVVPHGPTHRAVLAGWQATLHVTRFDDGLVVGITFVSRSAPASPGPDVSAQVSLSGTTEQVVLSGELSRSPMTIRGRLPAVPGARVVQAELTIASSRVTLVAPVPRATAAQAAPSSPEPATGPD